MTNNVAPDQSALQGALYSGSTLIANDSNKFPVLKG